MHTQRNWWETREFVIAAALLSMVPLLWPNVPPLVDLPGHMGRYRVQLDYGDTPLLASWYRFEWALIGNLGVDLLVIPLSQVFGLELAVKLITIAIPPLTAAGLLWIAREVHGRIPPTALFALPIAYSFPFHFGFINFALAMALALNGFALWLRLARTGHVRLRAALFVPISILIWVTHTFGWGTLGVLAFSAELVRQRDRGHPFAIAWVRAGIMCVPLALPLLLMLAWRSGHVGGQTADWFNWRAKIMWVTQIFRDRWEAFDIASLVILGLILFRGFRDPTIEYSRNLGMSALFLLAVFILLPRIVFGSAYADMRLAPFMLAIAVIALRPKHDIRRRGATTLAFAALAFFLVRTAGTTLSFLLYDRDYDRQLAALHQIPEGARVVSFVGASCNFGWKMTRFEHLPAMALVRNRAFSNDQWSMAGAQLLSVRYREAFGFNHDPSQIVTLRQCRREYWRPIGNALATFPRDAFDYVWLIAPPPYDARLTAGLVPVWRDGTSALYRVARAPTPF